MMKMCVKKENMHVMGEGKKPEAVFEEVWNKKAEDFYRKVGTFEMDPKLHRKLKESCESCNGTPFYCWQETGSDTGSVRLVLVIIGKEGSQKLWSSLG